MKKIVLAILVAFFLVGLFFIYKNLNKETTISEIPAENFVDEVKNPTPTLPDIPDDWKLYENNNLGISFAVPTDFEIEKNGEQSIIATPKDMNLPAGNTRFFYVSVVPENFEGEEPIYNYNKSDYEKLLSAKVNDRVDLGGRSGQEEWFTYERAGNDNFNGRVAKVFVNQKPWEFPVGTWEHRYIFELEDKIVIAGAYFEGGPSDAYFTLPLLAKIMNTVTMR